MNRSTTAHRPPKARLATWWFTWRHVRCKLVETPNYLHHGQTHLELHVIAARDTPVPLTHTGYRSHFIATDDLSTMGGAVAFMTAWLDREADSKSYKAAEARWRQGDLFDHAGIDLIGRR